MNQEKKKKIVKEDLEKKMLLDEVARLTSNNGVMMEEIKKLKVKTGIADIDRKRKNYVIAFAKLQECYKKALQILEYVEEVADYMTYNRPEKEDLPFLSLQKVRIKDTQEEEIKKWKEEEEKCFKETLKKFRKEDSEWDEDGN